ncbi:adenylosuccinate lyase [uncultured Winogradskyella sp.]|uniref:adenylosuccinate lyase n=1 Tax=uncultured Winogradskyella sp. TaxID=395353 RepID=UPI0035146D3A
MTTDQFYEHLKNVNATRTKRLECADLILNNPELFKPLMKLIFKENTALSHKAAWVFEFVCAQDLGLLEQHLNDFTTSLMKVKDDSAIRPVAKVCLFLVENNYRQNPCTRDSVLNDDHKEAITEACFNWLITKGKVAPKAYAMTCLYLLGKDFDWIHPELRLVLEKDYAQQSAGYKAKARHIMEALNAKT